MIEIGNQAEELVSAVAGAPTWRRLTGKVAPFCRPETIVFLFTWCALLMVGRSRFFLDPGA